MISWVFFRSESLEDAFNYLNRIIIDFAVPNSNLNELIFVFILLIMDWLLRKDERLSFKISWADYIIIPVMVLSIMSFISQTNQEFIYFQF